MKAIPKRFSVIKLKVIGIVGDIERSQFAQAKADWKALAVEIKRLNNFIWQQWQYEHIAQGNREKVRAWMIERTAWRKATQSTKKPGKGPNCPVKCQDKKIANNIYHAARAQFPGINCRSMVLALNKFTGLIGSLGAPKSAFKLWQTILAGEEGPPTYSYPLPIPFDADNGKLIMPQTDREHFQLECRVERHVNEKGKGESTLYRLVLMTGYWAKDGDRKKISKSMQQRRGLLERLKAIHPKQFRGSDLVFNQTTGEWFVHLVYEREPKKKIKADPKRIAMLWPGRRAPWWLRIPNGESIRGRRFAIMGMHARHVAHFRQQLLWKRLSRQESYRFSGTSRKGRGLKRAIAGYVPFAREWRRFVKTYNGQMIAQLLRDLEKHGCGRLIYYQPTERRRDRCLLVRAGKRDDTHDATGWDWYQVAAMLNLKCQEIGVEVLVKTSGKQRFAAPEKPIKGRKGKGTG